MSIILVLSFFSAGALAWALLTERNLLLKGLETIIGRLRIGGLRQKIDERMIHAGSPYNLTANRFLAIQVLSCLSAFLLTAILIGKICLLCFLLALLAYFFPSIWLWHRIEKRQADIRRELPYALDLLVLSVEAGLDFIAALSIIIDKSPGSCLRDELSRLLYEIKMGKRRRDAIRDLGLRAGGEALPQLCASLIQAEELGTKLGTVLRIHSEEMRRSQFAMAEKQAMEAPVKMLLPLIGFIFPAVFIILLGPIFIQLLQFAK